MIGVTDGWVPLPHLRSTVPCTVCVAWRVLVVVSSSRPLPTPFSSTFFFSGAFSFSWLGPLVSRGRCRQKRAKERPGRAEQRNSNVGGQRRAFLAVPVLHFPLSPGRASSPQSGLFLPFCLGVLPNRRWCVGCSVRYSAVPEPTHALSVSFCTAQPIPFPLFAWPGLTLPYLALPCPSTHPSIPLPSLILPHPHPF